MFRISGIDLARDETPELHAWNAASFLKISMDEDRD
jgi:hypothetical protein